MVIGTCVWKITVANGRKGAVIVDNTSGEIKGRPGRTV